MMGVNAGGRVVIGAALMLAPAWAGRRWIGRDAESPAVTVFTRALGARDLALGAGALAALARGQSVRPWALGALIADATDAVATALVRDELPARAGAASLGVAASAAAQDAWIAAKLD